MTSEINLEFVSLSSSSVSTSSSSTPYRKMSTSSAPDENWQITKSCLKERSKHMFNNNLISDVKFSVKDSSSDRQQRVVIPAHKFILAISSAVFFKMFYGEMVESRDIVELPDCNSESFLELLRFVYYDEVKLTGSNVSQIRNLAMEYRISSLSEKCSKFLQKIVSVKNVFSVLPEPYMYEEPSLFDRCWEIVDKQSKEAMGSEAFLDISPELLISVLDRDTLKVQEVEIFKAVDRWAAHNCEKQQREVTGEEKRKVLGHAISLIRFPLMCQREFASVVVKTGVLPKDDIIDVFLHFNDAISSLKFSHFPRHQTSCCKQRVARFKATTVGNFGFANVGVRSESLAFSVNRDVIIHGVRLFGRNESGHSVSLEICRQDKLFGDRIKLTEAEGRFQTEGEQKSGYYGFDVLLNLPTLVKKNETYVIRALIKGSYSHRGEQGQARVNHEKACFSFYNSSSSYSTNAERGQFPEILFST